MSQALVYFKFLPLRSFLEKCRKTQTHLQSISCFQGDNLHRGLVMICSSIQNFARIDHNKVKSPNKILLLIKLVFQQRNPVLWNAVSIWQDLNTHINYRLYVSLLLQKCIIFSWLDWYIAIYFSQIYIRQQKDHETGKNFQGWIVFDGSHINISFRPKPIEGTTPKETLFAATSPQYSHSLWQQEFIKSSISNILFSQ